MCQAFHCLPGPGGLFDQDWYLVHLLQSVVSAQEQKSKIDEQREANKARQAKARRK